MTHILRDRRSKAPGWDTSASRYPTPEEQYPSPALLGSTSADVHLNLERDIADLLETEASILYFRGFSTIHCVISAFAKRGDIIVANRGIDFAIQKGLQISRSTDRWFGHDDLKSLEDVLLSVEKECRKSRGPLTRRFIVTEGIFEKDGTMIDLPKLIEFKHKYKYRLILDGSTSFGTVGRTGRSLTGLYNAPVCVSFVTRCRVLAQLNSKGHANRHDHRIGCQRTEPIGGFLRRRFPPASTPASAKPPKPATPAPCDAPSFDIVGEECLLQDIVDEALAQGVWTAWARWLRGQELVEARSSIRLAATAVLSRKECDGTAGVVKNWSYPSVTVG
ncbi:pyridoxal phosphate-dependent transferase [Lactarius vividus]|nr:pyridoxal phosphate-dependent transferase [Lactarius vividus]